MYDMLGNAICGLLFLPFLLCILLGSGFPMHSYHIAHLSWCVTVAQHRMWPRRNWILKGQAVQIYYNRRVSGYVSCMCYAVVPSTEEVALDSVVAYIEAIAINRDRRDRIRYSILISVWRHHFEYTRIYGYVQNNSRVILFIGLTK